MANQRNKIDDGGAAFAGGLSLRDHAALEFAKMIYAEKGKQLVDDNEPHNSRGTGTDSVGFRVVVNAYQLADEFISYKRMSEM